MRQHNSLKLVEFESVQAAHDLSNRVVEITREVLRQ